MNTFCTGWNKERRKFLARIDSDFLHGMNQETKYQETTAWAAVAK
jgi:hypothetical protein